MSALRPSSVCDTTPLQQLENQSNSGSSSSGEPSSPHSFTLNGVSIGSAAAGDGGGGGDVSVADTKLGDGNLGADDALTIPPPSNIKGFSLANNKQINKNNKKIEIHLSDFVGDSKGFKMDLHETRKICCRVLLDILIVGCLVVPIVFFRIWGEPYKRGFFCDDASLKHPYRESTIQPWMLFMMGFVTPVSIIVSVEFFKSNEYKMRGIASYSTHRRYHFWHLEIADWLIECYKKIGLLIFGIGVGLLTSDIAKYSVGRLRPHFFAVCQPVMFDGSTCDHPHNAGRYIEQFECLGLGVDPKLLKQVSLSFPSGHSVFSFFTMVYLSIYLQQRMTWQRAKMFKHLLQFFCLMMAWYTALTRVSDYKHHWSDVLAGSTIGTFYAFTVSYIW